MGENIWYLHTHDNVQTISVYTIHLGDTSKGTVLLLHVVESAVRNIGPATISISEMGKTRLYAQIMLEIAASTIAAVSKRISRGKTVKTSYDTPEG
jgi:hypothetical protein